MSDEQRALNTAEKEWAESDDDRCWHEDCWLVNGHKGLHAYHPMFTGEVKPPRYHSAACMEAWMLPCRCGVEPPTQPGEETS